MGQVRVEYGVVRSHASKGAVDQPMRWALHKPSGQMTYIGHLRPEQNGDACECVCPTCGQALQAVNRDKDARHFSKPNALGMFFRHPSGHQRKDCQYLMARMAALHLLMACGELDLPAPRKTCRQQGVSGAIYPWESVGTPVRGRIEDKVWLDNQSARFTVDGRLILVLLQARPMTSADGAVDGVITIRVNDPAVASWTPEDILKALSMEPHLTCWDKHWDDDALIAQAQAHAAHAADTALDLIPPELGPMDELSHWQRSESILHAKVKDILAASGRLLVPGHFAEVIYEAQDNGVTRGTVRIPKRLLSLSNIRLEAPMQGLVPDVLCTARTSDRRDDPFELLIEVAVTHRVEPSKRQLLRARGLACLEIDLTRIKASQKRITVEHLSAAVLGGTDGKSWVCCPELDRLVTLKNQEFLEAERQRQHDRLQERERQDWLDKLSTDGLVRLLIPTLRRHWKSDKPLSLDNGRWVEPGDVVTRLASQGLLDGENRFIIQQGGLLDTLDLICMARRSGVMSGLRERLDRMENDPRQRPYMTLVLMAMETYHVRDASRIQQANQHSLRERIVDSLQKGSMAYARPTGHDGLLVRLFPDMARKLTKPFGTITSIRQAKEKQRLADEAAQLLELQKIEEREKAEHDKRQRILQLEGRVVNAMNAEGVTIWQTSSPASTIEEVLKQRGVTRLADRYSRSHMDVPGILRSAWEARHQRVSLKHWLTTQPAKDTSQVKMVIQALREAGFVG